MGASTTACNALKNNLASSVPPLNDQIIDKGWGNVTKEMKLVVYPAIAIALGGGLVGLFLSRYSITAWVEPVPSDGAPIAQPEPGSALDMPEETMERSPTPVTTPASEPLAAAPSEGAGTLPADAILLGKLRVSNQTNHPVRVALMAQVSPPEVTETDVAVDAEVDQARSPQYQEPVHWDFAPQEGSTRGLLLTLPDSDLTLTKGDILVAFAQDGSRRYWGPYVVGETLLPFWNGETSEWQLVIQP